MRLLARTTGWISGLALAVGLHAESFRFPTANRALLNPERAASFFAPTPGKTWTAGTFGLVRTDGRQLHEGIDILSVKRDSRGEPADPVLASATGTVAYVNRTAGLSTYGQYIVLRHQVEGMEVYTLYAHLSRIRADLAPGSAVRAEDPIATLGRTSSTAQRITKDRAHLHFEVCLLLSDRFAAWLKQTQPKERNDHGNWNGRNLAGIDPAAILKGSAQFGDRFSLLQNLRAQHELCRVVVVGKAPQWVRRYPQLVERNPETAGGGIGGYELVFNSCGLLFRAIPRSASGLAGRRTAEVLSVNRQELQEHPGQRLLTQKNGRWQLSRQGAELLDLICY